MDSLSQGLQIFGVWCKRSARPHQEKEVEILIVQRPNTMGVGVYYRGRVLYGPRSSGTRPLEVMTLRLLSDSKARHK